MLSRSRFALVCALMLGASPVLAAGRISKGPWVQRVGPTTALVRVEVEPPGAVALDVAGPAGHQLLEDKDVKSLHAFPLEGLTPASHYTYSVRAAAGAANATKSASFSTPPPEGVDTPFTFLAFGDNRTDDAAHASVVRAMVPFASDLLIHTGDFVENGGSLAQWQTFFDIEAPLLSTRCLVSAVGNHELVDGAGVNYVKFFGPPNGNGMAKPEHLDHTFRWGNTRFFLLNGISSFKPGSVERVWLEKVLGDADGEAGVAWRVAVVHHGPWSSGPHGSNPRFHEQAIPALLKKHKVDVILSGHDHIYDRGVGPSAAGGLPYIVTGGGGAPLYRLKNRIAESRKGEAAHHFVEATVGARTMQLTAVRADGSRIERCSLSKDAEGWFCGEPAPPAVDGGAPSLGEPEPPPPPLPPSPSACACSEVGTYTRLDRSAALVALLLPFVAYARRRRRY